MLSGLASGSGGTSSVPSCCDMSSCWLEALLRRRRPLNSFDILRRCVDEPSLCWPSSELRLLSLSRAPSPDDCSPLVRSPGESLLAIECADEMLPPLEVWRL